MWVQPVVVSSLAWLSKCNSRAPTVTITLLVFVGEQPLGSTCRVVVVAGLGAGYQFLDSWQVLTGVAS